NTQDKLLTSVTSNTLAPGESQSFTVNVTIPAQGTSGMLFIGVIADALGAVSESAEDNNTVGAKVTVVSMADLAVPDLKVTPVSVSPGEMARVEFSVNNLGSAAAGPHVEEVRLSTDNMIKSTDPLLETLTSAGIAAGSSTQFVVNIQIPNNIAPGAYFIGVVA